MPKKGKKSRRNRRRGTRGTRSEPNQDALSLRVPSFKKPDVLRISHCTTIQLVESLGDFYYVWLRASSYAINQTSFTLYADQFFTNVLLRLADYYTTYSIGNF